MALPLLVWGGIAAAGAVAALVARDRIVNGAGSAPDRPAPNTAIGAARTINLAFPLVTTGLAVYGGWRLYNEVLR